MSGVLKLGRIFNIDIKVHFSWVFIFALVAWSLASSFLPDSYPGWTRAAYWAVGILGSALLFVCVLIHELSHSLVAIYRGRKVQGITLFFLGGVSEIEEEAASPGEEFWISVVGPLSSLALAAIFWGLFLASPTGSSQYRALVEYLAFVNITIGVFNMVPAFPLDGGRVLKALIWRASGSEERAISVASITGSALGFALIGVGVFFAFANSLITGIWFIFIGWFIQSSASSVRRQEHVERVLSGKLVRDAMREDFPTVGPGVSVQQLVDDYITREFERAYLVVLGNTLRGLVTVTDVKRVPPDQRANMAVTNIMKHVSEVVTARPDEPLEAALEKLITHPFHQLVVTENGKPVGLLTRGDVLRVMEVAELFPEQGLPERR